MQESEALNAEYLKRFNKLSLDLALLKQKKAIKPVSGNCETRCKAPRENIRQLKRNFRAAIKSLRETTLNQVNDVLKEKDAEIREMEMKQYDNALCEEP